MNKNVHHCLPAVSLFSIGTVSWLGRNVALLHSIAILDRAFHVADVKAEPPTVRKKIYSTCK